MKFKREARQNVDINLTPLIDVVFLLLIFFMVSTSFIRESHIAVDLPSVEKFSPLKDSDIGLEVIIDQSGLYQINNKTIDVRGVGNAREILASALKNSSQGDASQPLTLAADAAAPYQAVVQIMDVAGQLGFNKIQMATQTEAKQASEAQADALRP